MFRWLERIIFLGEIIKDYGVIQEKKQGIARSRLSILLCRRNGKISLVLKTSHFAYVGGGVSYQKIDAENLPMLKNIVDDVLPNQSKL